MCIYIYEGIDRPMNYRPSSCIVNTVSVIQAGPDSVSGGQVSTCKYH